MKEALIGVVVGWILSQLTTVGMTIYNRSQKKNALRAEIEDLKIKGDNVQDTCNYSLGLMLEGGYAFTSPSPVETHVKDAVFSDIYTDYDPVERAGIKAIYELVDQINECTEMPSDTIPDRVEKLRMSEIEAARLSITADEFLNNGKNNRLVNRDEAFQDDILTPKLNAIVEKYDNARNQIQQGQMNR